MHESETQTPATATNTNGEACNTSIIHTCDICPRVIFESEAALERHIELRHKSMMENINTLLETKNSAFEFTKDGTELQTLGQRAFDIASKRDAGPQMLQCASTAREQLQHIVNEWHPGAEVFIFGSSLVMSSWDGKSDIDFAVVDPKAYVEKRWPPDERQAVRELTELCKAAGFRVSSLECVDTARVPIVKHKTLQSALQGAEKQGDSAAKSKRSVYVRYQSEKLKTHDELLRWLEKELDPKSIESAEVDTTNRSIITFKDSTSALVAMLRINCRQKKRLNEIIAAQMVDEHIPPEAHCIDFDLCLRQFGIRNSEYLRKLHTLHENSAYLRCGAVVLKEWSKLWGLNNSFMGFLTSYAINIMWIYFLIQRGLIPYVSPYDTPENPKDALRKPTYVPILPENTQLAATQEKMGQLLTDFFKFYATEFDWDKHVITLNRPGITEKKTIGWTSENEVKLSRQSKNVRYVICIEDPYEPNLNLGRHLGVCKARKIKAEFRRAALSAKVDSIDECILFSSKYKKETYVPMKEPPQELLLKMQGIVSEALGESKGTVYTPESLRALLMARVPETFKSLLTYWSWKVLVRRLGLRQVGDQIQMRASFAFLSEKARGQPMVKLPLDNVTKISAEPIPEIRKASFNIRPVLPKTNIQSMTNARSLPLRTLMNTFRLFRI